MEKRRAPETLYEGTDRPRSAHRNLPEQFQRFDLRGEQTKDPSAAPTEGSASSAPKIQILSNFFQFRLKEGWRLYEYHLEFSPQIDSLPKRRGIMLQLNQDTYGYIFDGTVLVTPKLLVKEDRINAAAKYPVVYKEENFEVTLKLTGKPQRSDPVCNQVYNLLVRKCMFAMGLKEVGRNFYDPKAKITLSKHNVELWPGYTTAIRQHENEALISVEITHKVLRIENALNFIQSMRKTRNFPDCALEELKKSSVMTCYNNRFYHVDGIDWDISPMSTFQKNGAEITFLQYYQDVYNQLITDLEQPLLVSRATKKDLKRGITNDILLIPELCQLTGLSDAMRANFTLMRELTQHLNMGPNERVSAVKGFMDRMVTNERVQQLFQKWDLSIDPTMVKCPIKMMKKESICFADGTHDPNAAADWTLALRSRKFSQVHQLDNWFLFAPEKDRQQLPQLISTLTKVAASLSFIIKPPRKIVHLEDVRPPAYVRAINECLSSGPVQFVFAVLPAAKEEPYTSIKKCLTVEKGIPSQCYVSKNLYAKGFMSILTKVVIQINAKLGGQPWEVKMPLKNLMVIGYDSYKVSNTKYVGAMVATLKDNMAKYFSNVNIYSNNSEVAGLLPKGINDCLKAYYAANQCYPDRIAMYRDGIIQGQEEHISELEAKAIGDAVVKLYEERDLPPPKFVYLVVNRKSNARFFVAKNGKYENPGPGTVIDETVALPPEFNFFLVAHSVRQGTISPCSYRIFYSTMNWELDRTETVCYKLCHLYYNWTGTVGVIAPCQYAKRLAYFVANILKGDQPNERLSGNLHFL